MAMKKPVIKSLGASHADSLLLATDLKEISDEQREHILVSNISRYEHDCWDLSTEYPDNPPHSVRLNFAKLIFPDGDRVTSPGKRCYLSAFKDYALTMLKDPPASQPKWSTFCNSSHRGISSLFKFMHSSGIQFLSDVTPTDLSRFLGEIALMPLHKGGQVSNHTLRSRVFGLHWLYEQSSKMKDALLFDPFVEYGDINAWAKNNCEYYIRKHERRTVEMPDSVAKALLQHAIDDLSLADTIEEVLVARAAQDESGRKSNGRELVGHDSPLAFSRLNYDAYLMALRVRLTAACYIVIAMLTGMRWHEVSAIKIGRDNNWSAEDIDHDGLRRKFYFVVSKTYKLHARPKEYMWQTLPIVELALDAAERGLAYYRKNGEFLFSACCSNDRMSSSSLSSYFHSYAHHWKVSFNGEIWVPASHQFRRKFSRIMIRQGLGLRALQDQLKHFDIEMTRGYGDMNLYVELQQEKFCLSSEQYAELVGSQVPIIGGGASEVNKLREQFLGLTKKEKIKFLAELPRSAVIEQVDDGLCMYRASKALCGGDRAACRPADCNNSVLLADGKRKTFEWRRGENIKLLAFFESEPLKVAYLRDRIVELDKLLHQLSGLD